MRIVTPHICNYTAILLPRVEFWRTPTRAAAYRCSGDRAAGDTLYSKNGRADPRQQHQVNNLGMLLSLLEQLPLAILFLGFEKPLQFLHALLRLCQRALRRGQCLRSIRTYLRVSYERSEACCSVLYMNRAHYARKSRHKHSNWPTKYVPSRALL